MVKAQQFQVAPGQLTTGQQLTTAPGVLPAQLDISSLLTSIMPLMMLMMVFAMIMPMFKGMSEAFSKAS